ncbi:MAG: A24 family peptidase [Lachnospiraceae bacterium]|nr:A24 family peptidase [Lachnospiraceae bacterium]
MTITAILLSVAAVVTDVRTDKIPNVLTVIGIITGALFRIILSGPGEAGAIIVDVAAAFAVTFILFLIKALRGGDGKLLCALSAMLGFPATVMILVFSLLLAAVVGCVKMIFTKRKLFSKTFIHFSIPMACSVMVYATGLITR